MSDSHIVPDRFRLKADQITILPPTPIPEQPPRNKTKKFIKGPISKKWITMAAALPGKSVVVGLAIWFQHGLTNSNKFKLTGALLRDFYVGRKAAYRALQHLEHQGLIAVVRHRGRSPIVTLLQCE